MSTIFTDREEQISQNFHGYFKGAPWYESNGLVHCESGKTQLMVSLKRNPQRNERQLPVAWFGLDVLTTISLAEVSP